MTSSDSDSVAHLEFDDNRLLQSLLGAHDLHILRIENALDVVIVVRGNVLRISGSLSDVTVAENALKKLYRRLQKELSISESEVDAAIRMPKSNSSKDEIKIQTRRRAVFPRSSGQTHYVEALNKRHMVFAVGPAGTGKTYLAVATGVSMLLQGKVDRIILSRTAVEAGEHLGFLPGALREKIDPYLRPLYDALYDMMPAEQVTKRLENGEIEIAPLAFMRGRTLAHAYVILDEAQNTSIAQLKMFLTRLGEGSYMVVTGDLTQIDLPPSTVSGLKDATTVLKDVSDIKFIYLNETDRVRHPLVNQIIKAYG